MADEILSQEEVDALLRGVTGEEDNDGADSDNGGVRAYDIGRQERIVRGRMPTLEIINERFARYLRVGLFNFLLYVGPLQDKPLTAKAISVIAATTFAYFGNRFWTFRHRGRTHMGREYILFFALNGVAMLIALSCLWLSHYALGLDSPIADNISANVIGLGLGTLFRFWSYRKWVFPEIPAGDAADQELAERDAVTPI